MSVLIIGYRRRDEITKVIESVSKLKPKNLYLAMDGPRDSNSKNLCEAARKAALNAINWDCILHTQFNKENIGTAFIKLSIDWFFQNEKEGLILEDDVMIHPDFIFFAKRFINLENVCCVSACIFEDELDSEINRTSYCFTSNIPSIWGWYTTKQNWEDFRKFQRKKTNPILYFLKFKRRIGFWQSLVFAMCLNYVDRGKLLGWDYEFAYYASCRNKKAVFPGICMAKNIGNSNLAEHCSSVGENLSPEINLQTINFKELNKIPYLNKTYMKKQTMNIMMKNEYKIQAIKGLIYYFIPKSIKKLLQNSKIN